MDSVAYCPNRRPPHMAWRSVPATAQYAEFQSFQHTPVDVIRDTDVLRSYHDDAGLGSGIYKSSEDLFEDGERLRSKHPPSGRKNFWSRLQANRSGWKFGLYVGLFTSILVLVGNVALLFVGLYSHGGSKSAIGTLAVANGDYIHKLSIGYHIAINILSTVLLVSSNYAMQVLCAPTRAEVDDAHQRGMWMDIGIVSMHNLRFISRRRMALWYVLLLSSVPLHLFYNSAVFEVLVGQDYRVNTTNAAATTMVPTGWENLTNARWMHTYSHQYIEEFSDISLVISDVSAGIDPDVTNGSWTVTIPSVVEPTDCFPLGPVWQPSGGLSLSLPNVSFAAEYIIENNLSLTYPVTINVYDMNHLFLNNSWPEFADVQVSDDIPISARVPTCHNSSTKSTWLKAYPFKVQYALAKQTPYSSKVQVALPFIAIVILANLLKAIAIWLTIRWSSSDYILTAGDAIASFLERPEESSVGKCLHTKADITRNEATKKSELPWRRITLRIASTLGGKRIGTIAVCVLAIALDGTAIIGAVPNEPSLPGVPADTSNKAKWGTASNKILPFTPATFDARSILTNAFVANAPQVVLSLVYFSINRIYTSACFEREWNSYGRSKKALRVTSPMGQQRPTYFLQLPYRWAITLALASGFLHWLLSQALFITRREFRDVDGNMYEKSVCACGYSPWSLLAFSLAFSAVLMATVMVLFRRIEVWVPVAAHCSAVISAACHPPPDEVDPQLKEVQWGVVKNRFGGTIQHCTFTSEDVTFPREGALYA